MYHINSEYSFIGPQKNFDLICENANDEYTKFHFITEKTKKSLFDKLKELIQSIILSFKKLGDEIMIRIQTKRREKEYEQKLKDDLAKIDRLKETGVNVVELIDMENYKNKYEEMNNKLHQFAKKFTTIKYNNTWEIEDDFAEFDDIIEDYKETMKEASTKTITVPIEVAKQMRTDELRGKESYVKELMNEMRKFNDYEMSARRLKDMYEIKGEDVLPAHESFFVKILNKICSTIQKMFVKIITTTAFVFA